MSPDDGLKALGVDTSWCIVISDAPAAAERTAAGELEAFLREQASLAVEIVAESEAPEGRGIVLGTPGSVKRIARLKRNGDIRVGEAVDDGFHLKVVGEDVIVAGNNPRGVLYGLCRLIDWLRGDRAGDVLDLSETPHFRERWMCPTLHGRTDEERNFRYMARLGVNTSYLRARRDPFIDIKHFYQYVTEERHLPEISEAAPPHAGMVEMADGACRLALAHGMSIVMLMDEPAAIPARDSKSDQAPKALPPELLDRLDPDMLGRAYLPPFRADGWKALSVFHPKVEAHYAEMLGQLLARYPELKTLYVYNEDCAAANCYPPDEPVAKDAYPPGYEGYPYAAHLHLTKVLQEAGRRIKPDLRLCTVSYHWYIHDELRRKMVTGVPAGSVLITLAAWDDSIDTTVLPDWTHDLIRQARDRGDLVLLADDDFTATSDDLLMEVTAGFPMPFRTWKKCRAWAEAGVAGITQHHTGGPTLGVNGINDLAWRVFTWRPLMTPDEAEGEIRRLTLRQLGSAEATRRMMTAYGAVERALDAVEDDLDNRPYCSRLHHSFPPHLEHGLKRDWESTSDYIGDGIDPASWRHTLGKEVAAYAEALDAAKEAAELAPADREPFYLWCDPGHKVTCRDYARMTADAIEVVLRFRMMFLHFLEAEKRGQAPFSGEDLTEVWRSCWRSTGSEE